MRVPERIVDSGFRGLNRFHRALRRITGARLGARAFGMSIVEVRTIGRSSGLKSTVLLAAPVVNGATIVLVASKGGDDRYPEWFKNLIANPDIDVSIDRRVRQMRARLATSSECAELWPRVIAAYAPYAAYRKRANREIPLVICEPR